MNASAKKSAAKSAPRGAVKPSNVVSIVKPDAKLADERGKADRALILDGIDQAESMLGEALIAGLRMTILHGRTSTEEVAAHYTRCNNPAVYASWFNLGHKAQAIVGMKLAGEAIDRALTAKGGSAFQRAREALAAIGKAASVAGVKTVDGRKATALVKEAVAFSATSAKDRVAKKLTAKASAKGAQAPKSATLAAAAIESGKGAKETAHAVKLIAQNASRMAAPEGKESAWKEAVAALQLASEKFATFAK